MFTLSPHVQRRMAERNIQLPYIEMMFSYGKAVHSHGRTAWYMPKDVQQVPGHLQKLVLISTPDHHAITAYWSSKSALRTIRKSIKKSIKKRFS